MYIPLPLYHDKQIYYTTINSTVPVTSVTVPTDVGFIPMQSMQFVDVSIISYVLK